MDGPAVGRIHEHVAGGSASFAPDREIAGRLRTLIPDLAELSLNTEAFTARAARWASGQGAGQFLDLSPGVPEYRVIPLPGGGAGVAEPPHVAAGDAARVVYVRPDPVIAATAAALLDGTPGVIVAGGDPAEAGYVLDQAARWLDLDAPVCVLASRLLPFWAPSKARDVIAAYAEALAPRSAVAVTSIRFADPGLGGKAAAELGMPLYDHDENQIASFLDGLELIPPGVAPAESWRPGWQDTSGPHADVWIVGAVARKP